MEKKELQERLVQLSVLDGRLRQLQQSLVLLEQQMVELQLSQLALEELKKKPSGEILAPIGSGIFVRARLEQVQEVLLDVGAKVLCKRSFEDANEFIKQRLQKIIALHQALGKEIESTAETLAQLEQELQG